MGTCSTLRKGAWALWKSAWLVVSLHKHSLFLVVKCSWNSTRGLLGNWADAPGVTGSGEDTGGLKHEEGEVFDCFVG